MTWSGRRVLLVAFVLSLPLVTPKIRGADEIEYFAYLRSIVFDRDVEFGNEYQRFYDADPSGLAGFKATFLDLREPRTGYHINFAPMGSAVLWSPFYLLAHAGVLVARALGSTAPADGFGPAYAAAACYASALYGFLGLLLIHDGLVRFGRFGDTAAALAVLAVWFGTPLLYYMTIAPAFSHATSVFAVALVIGLALRLAGRAETSLLEWLALGAAIGIAGLVREQDALFGIVPAGVLLAETLRARDYARGVLKGALLGAAAALVFSPQLVAYHSLNGGWGPSRMVARKMTYLSPHFVEVLFDPGHGLYLWSPLLLVASAGLLLLVLRRRDVASVLLLGAFLLQIWINGSLESWTQAGAFGSRRFVSVTPVFAFGLCTVLAPIVARYGRSLAAAAVVLCAWWNVSLMVQFGLRLMDRQRLEWPKVAINQVTQVPPRLARTALLFLTDRERLRERP